MKVKTKVANKAKTPEKPKSRWVKINPNSIRCVWHCSKCNKTSHTDEKAETCCCASCGEYMLFFHIEVEEIKRET